MALFFFLTRLCTKMERLAKGCLLLHIGLLCVQVICVSFQRDCLTVNSCDYKSRILLHCNYCSFKEVVER